MLNMHSLHLTVDHTVPFSNALHFCADLRWCDYFLRKQWQYCFQHRQNFITCEPLHLAWWGFAWTCTLTISWTLLNIMVKVTWFFCFSCMHDTAWTGWPGFTKCHSLDGATLLLPVEAPAATCRQYLASGQGLTVLFSTGVCEFVTFCSYARFLNRGVTRESWVTPGLRENSVFKPLTPG